MHGSRWGSRLKPWYELVNYAPTIVTHTNIPGLHLAILHTWYSQQPALYLLCKFIQSHYCDVIHQAVTSQHVKRILTFGRSETIMIWVLFFYVFSVWLCWTQWLWITQLAEFMVEGLKPWGWGSWTFLRERKLEILEEKKSGIWDFVVGKF